MTTAQKSSNFDSFTDWNESSTNGIDLVILSKHFEVKIGGVVRIYGDIIYEQLKIVGQVEMFGINIGSFDLNPSDPTVRLGFNNGLSKGEVVLQADFTSKNLRALGKGCVSKIPSGWNCRDFNEVIITW